MIMIFYLITPVFSLFVRNPRLLVLLVLLVPFSLLAHRPAIIPHAEILELGAYYASVYVFGMAACRFRSRLVQLAPVLMGALGRLPHGAARRDPVQSVSRQHEGAHLFTQEHGPIDWTRAQKLLLCVALLAVAQRFGDRLARLSFVRYLGFASFSVNLLHCYLIDAIKLTIGPLHLSGTVLTWAGITVLALFGALGVVALGRRVLGEYSLYVLGSTAERTESRPS